MCGNSAYCWKTVLTSRLYGGVPTASTPPIRISPSSGCSKPAIIRSDVVLPQPDGPSSERNSPLRTWKVDAVDRRQRAEALGDRAELDVVDRPRPVGAHANCLPPMTHGYDEHAPAR